MDFGDFSITKRELLVSIAIIAIMLAFGIWISDGITEARLDADEVYNTALKVESVDVFEYGMNTNIGNAFVYGDLKAVDTVTFPEIGGEYMYIRKVTERYTKHTRVVTKTRTVNGKTQTYTDTETYWTWDEIYRESDKCEEITFLGIAFDSDKIDIPNAGYIDTIKETSKLRHKYYGTGTEFVGTIFTDLRDGTISDGSNFYKDLTIAETVERLKAFDWTAGFWVVWVLITGFLVFGFYYIDNRWLE